MSLEDLTPHIKDIMNSLDENSEKTSQEEIKKELEKFLEYGVPIEQAKQTLITKFTGNISLNSSNLNSERILISNLQPNERSVSLLCHVIAINPKDIKVKGEDRKIFYGILGDESGTIPFTAWTDFEIEKGDVIKVTNAYTREWQGNIQLNFGDRVNIEKTDKKQLPKSAFEPKEHKVKELRSGLGSVDVKAIIMDLNERTVEVNGDEKKVYSGIIVDETGKAQFTSWHDFKLEKGEYYQISGGYVKTWKGIPQLTFDDKAKVKKLDKKKLSIDTADQNQIPIHELIEKKGALDIIVIGTIIEIRPGSGVILRCPECNRTLINDGCSIHGSVKGNPDLRIKIVIDDGTGAIGGILNREITENILGKKLEECIGINEDEFLEEINKKLFAHMIKIQGNALGDSFGTTLIVKNFDFVDVNITEKTSQMLKDLEEMI
jgi:replication factor A1